MINFVKFIKDKKIIFLSLKNTFQENNLKNGLVANFFLIF